MKKYINGIALVLVAAFVIGCTTTPISLSPSSTYIHPDDVVTEIGPVSGSAWATFFVGIPMGEQRQIGPALRRALKKSGADAIIECKTEFKTYNFYIFTVLRTNIYGTGVKIKKGARRR